MDDREEQPGVQARLPLALGVHNSSLGALRPAGKPPSAAALRSAVGVGSSQEPGCSKENQADALGAVKSEYVKDRQPARGILRKADDGSWEKLQSKFSSLEGELLTFSSQTQSRRDSLTARGSAQGPLLPAQASSQHPLPTAASQPSAPSWLPPPRAVPPLPPALPPQPEPLPTTSALYNADTSGSQDDDGCTGGLGQHSKDSFITIPAGAVGNSKVAKAAADTFEDPSFQKMVAEGLHKQLQRTKDGATDKSRIQELAELVKMLRKCIKDTGSRATTYIDACVKLEREASQQVEAVKLSSRTSIRQLEAELASTRQSLAECERETRNDKAKWGLDLDTQKAEASRLVRELERVTEERDRAREEAKRAEQARQQLDADLKELRKYSATQQRERSANQSEEVRRLHDEKTAAENRISGLRDEVNKISTTFKAAQEACTEYEREVQLLRASVDNLKGSLAGKEAAAAVQSEHIVKLQKELASTKEQLAAATTESQRQQQELAQGAEDRAALATEVEQRCGEVTALRESVAGLQQRGDEDRVEWEAKKQELEAALAGVTAERDQALNMAGTLKNALSSAMAKLEDAEKSLAREAAERASLMREQTNLQHQLEFSEGAQAAAEAAAAQAKAKVAEVEAELSAAKQAVEDKEGRLAHMEGEFEALKEVLGETTTTAGGAGSKDVVATLLSKIATLQNAAAAAEAVRRKLHNELVDLKGNIRVYCRVRPHATPSTRLGPDGASLALAADGREHAFAYDKVFGPDSSQEAVFGSVSELVQSALDGFHVCIFSYGQTGAGKTHTMQGGDAQAARGIIPRAVEKILSTARKLEEQAEWSYSMEASFIEIYNNQLRDLLGGTSGPSSYINDLHAIKHDPDGGHTIVAGVSKVPVTDADGAAALCRKAAAARAVEATAMNRVSSRSHSVFMLYITGYHAGSGTRLQGCLCLVDLAGSERLDRSLAEGQAKKEACAINASLSSLGDVFAALSSKSSHVPYRNSKLTYLLQPCLGGSGKTLMFVNINPEPASAGESLCSLRFAAKVSGCETGAKGGARRNVLTLGGGGGMGGDDPAGSVRCSLPGLPRGPGGMDAAAAKRMSMAPVRSGAGGTDAGASRMSLAGVGQKRSAGAASGNPAKRSRP
ncbi:hypothetical protein HYH03_006997 [Edaphochlamys debaryana]|uniref:Kinesin motor domain-containing protein n=1 Tax=Edaphochlamys debaryana TaxID=47281 RepID=A0A835Y3Z0_9CHLO|nr:hypothetical protein HYH03_006997 [Edaphochlamys debaryana]|eukprot:KAG2494752.1 hypothetical protein HYH03_006997 [Edaphochlamys debaryana]